MALRLVAPFAAQRSCLRRRLYTLRDDLQTEVVVKAVGRRQSERPNKPCTRMTTRGETAGLARPPWWQYAMCDVAAQPIVEG
jgi:hypothetical protein